MREIDVADLEPALRDGATLVDVREAAEYAEGHVHGAGPAADEPGVHPRRGARLLSRTARRPAYRLPRCGRWIPRGARTRAGTGLQPDWGLVLLLTAASSVGVLVGARLAARVDTRRLTQAFTGLVLAVAVATASQALPALL